MKNTRYIFKQNNDNNSYSRPSPRVLFGRNNAVFHSLPLSFEMIVDYHFMFGYHKVRRIYHSSRSSYRPYSSSSDSSSSDSSSDISVEDKKLIKLLESDPFYQFKLMDSDNVEIIVEHPLFSDYLYDVVGCSGLFQDKESRDDLVEKAKGLFGSIVRYNSLVKDLNKIIELLGKENVEKMIEPCLNKSYNQLSSALEIFGFNKKSVGDILIRVDKLFILNEDLNSIFEKEVDEFLNKIAKSVVGHVDSNGYSESIRQAGRGYLVLYKVVRD